MRTNDALSYVLTIEPDNDNVSRTPLHLAAWEGNVKQIAKILGFSKDYLNRLAADPMSEATDLEIRRLSEDIKDLVNVKYDFSRASSVIFSKDTVDRQCEKFENLPPFQPGWSALHAASARAQSHCARLLLTAGADPCARDFDGKTPLDIAGSAYYKDEHIDSNNFADIVTLLIDTNCKNFTLKNRKILDTPLHTAVEIGSIKAVSVLVGAKFPVNWLNRAGVTPMHLCVKKKFKEHLQILANHGVNDSHIPVTVDAKDKDGRTVLHEAVLENWAAGVCIAIEAGANIIAKDRKSETPIHFAAVKGNADILATILKAVKQKEHIDTRNNLRETALFKAVINGHTECVKILLKEGASMHRTLAKGVNVFHVAADKGYLDVLRILLDHDYSVTRMMVNYTTADDRKGYGPIHFAVLNNHPECVQLLLSRNAHRKLRVSYGFHKGSTPLHLAGITNNVEIAKIIMENNEDTVHTINDSGWSPLHTASYNGSRDMIQLLVTKGADLASITKGPNNYKTSAIDMIMNNLSRPTEFVENILDARIYTNDSTLQDPNCEVKLDYNILVPKAEGKVQMNVIDALLKTGDRHGQRRLLVHPLIESFLFLKWKALLPFFYTMIALYAFFVLSLTTFIISVFTYKDTNSKPPFFFNAIGWVVTLYINIILIISQEIIFMKVNSRYFQQLESWVKFTSVCLAVTLPYIVNKFDSPCTNWPRHIATVALLLAWLEMMFLLSRFPNWGYYVLMFGKVSANVIKILLTFAFLVIGFSLSFMVQFHAQTPFEHLWAALVKTIVMMTSEFDYDDLMEQTNTKEFVTSLFVVRLIFFLFLILAAIVLMNLMVGVAVNDLQNLETLGNVMRLGKQVEFLGSLENLVYSRLYFKMLPKWLKTILKNQTKHLNYFILRPSKPKSKCYKALPSHVRDGIFKKTQVQKKHLEEELGFQNDRKKLDEIYAITVKNHSYTEPYKLNIKSNRIRALPNSKTVPNRVRNLNINNQIKLSKSSIEEINFKMDIILKKLENIPLS